MAAADMKMDVILTCGQVETVIGVVTVPAIVKTGPAQGDALPFSIEADMPAFRANLAALLREAADAIAIENDDFDQDERDDRS